MNFKYFDLIKLFIIYCLSCSIQLNGLEVNVESPIGSGVMVKKDLIEFIEEGKLNINTNYETIIKKRALMVLGVTGTGKTTLVNYLNGIPLICKRINGVWRIDLKDANVTLPGGFSIGHKVQSETLYPSIYTPNNADFTYIDNPGFKDTRGIGIEIANGFFRKQVIDKVDELKFLLLVTHADLNDKGPKFRESIKGFSDFLGIFDENTANHLSKSIGIVVAAVDNDGDTDEEVKVILLSKLLEILNDENQSGKLSINEYNVFKSVILNNQIEIFSNPRRNVILDNIQKNEIIKQINNLFYISKKEAKIRVRIDRKYLSELLVYIGNLYEKFQINFDKIFEQMLTNLLKKADSIMNLDDASSVYKIIIKLQNDGNENKEFNIFLDDIQNLIENNDKIKLLDIKKFLDYFIDLVPDENKIGFNFNKKWINIYMNNLIDKSLATIVNFGKKDYLYFIQTFQNELEKSLINYFKVEIEKPNQRIPMSEKLLRIRSMGTQPIDFSVFLQYLSNEIPISVQMKSLLIKRSQIDNFVSLLQNDDKKEYSFIKQWINLDLNQKILFLLKPVYYLEKAGMNVNSRFKEEWLDLCSLYIYTEPALFVRRKQWNSCQIKLNDTILELKLKSNSDWYQCEWDMNSIHDGSNYTLREDIKSKYEKAIRLSVYDNNINTTNLLKNQESNHLFLIDNRKNVATLNAMAWAQSSYGTAGYCKLTLTGRILRLNE